MDGPTNAELSWLSRAATALTLDRDAAVALVARTLRAYPEPSRISEGRLLRAMWLGAEGPHRPTLPDHQPQLPGLSPLAAALARAADQLNNRDQRDLIMFRFGCRWPLHVIAPAHDLSIDQADAQFDAAIDAVRAANPDLDVDRAAADLHDAFERLSFDPTEPTIASALRANRNRRRAVTLLGAIAVIVFLVAMSLVTRDLLNWDERQDELRRFSNPLPEELSDESLSPGPNR